GPGAGALTPPVAEHPASAALRTSAAINGHDEMTRPRADPTLTTPIGHAKACLLVWRVVKARSAAETAKSRRRFNNV
ncbi:hypothetical protein NL533_31180, partial [Klebsiella pneumoniae]|nr:hypothetical protein [Klebsiella pneumoniae]